MIINNKYIFIINILFIFINIILIFLYLNIKKDDYINKANYSLYNLFKYPQISVLIPNIDEFTINVNISIFNFLNSLINQTLKEIEIFFIFSKKKH